MNLPLENLLVMQADLRYKDVILSMAEYVKSGGFWNVENLKQYAKEKHLSRVSPLIAISRFEDGNLFIHDGHHRSCSVILGDRDYLRDDEFKITDWLYSDYLEIAPHNGWYTPFDPRVHVRTADFAKFKQEAKQRFLLDQKEATNWLYENFDKFRTDRKIHTISEFAELIKKEIMQHI